MKSLTFLLLFIFLQIALYAQTWSEIKKPQKGNISKIHIHKINSDIIYIATNNKFFKSSDNGISWNLCLTDPVFFEVAPSNQNIIYTKSWRSTDGGNTWQSITSMPYLSGAYNPKIAIHPLNPNIIFAAGFGPIKKTINGGLTWSEVLPNVYIDKIIYNDLDSSVLYALGVQEVYKSIDKGSKWSKVYSNINLVESKYFIGVEIYNNILYSSIDTTSSGSAFVYGQYIVKSSDGGSSWVRLSNPLDYKIKCITSYKIIKGVIYITTDKGLFRSNNDGVSWELISNDKDYYKSVDATTTKIVLGSCFNGISIANKSDLIFKNAGVENLISGFTKINYSTNGNVIVIDDDVRLFSFNSVNNYWKTIIPPCESNSGYNHILSFYSFNTIKLFCAIGNKFYKSNDNGVNWLYISDLPTGFSPEFYAISSDDQKIFLGKNNMLIYSLNEGVSWNSVSIPANIYDIHYSNTNNLYISTINSYYYSSNNGAVWQEISGLPLSRQIASQTINYDKSNNDKLYCTVSSGQKSLVYSKESGSLSWVQKYSDNINLIYGKIISNPAGSKLYSTGSNYSLFSSLDFGVTWGICSDTFNFYKSQSYFIVKDNMWFVNDDGSFWVCDINKSTLKVSSNSISLQSTASINKTFSIYSNISWSLSSNQNWLTVSKTSGLGGSVITLNALANTETKNRTAVLTIIGSGVPNQIINITQDASSPFLTVTPSTIEISSIENSTKTFNISSNISWSLISNQNWLTVSKTSGLGGSDITLKVLVNKETKNRTAEITITGSGVPNQIINITQDAALPYLTVTPSTIEISSVENSTKTFNISSNITWSVLNNQNWLTLSKSSGSGDVAVTLTAQANPSTEIRSAILAVSGTSVPTQSITVSQFKSESITNILNENSSDLQPIFPIPTCNNLFFSNKIENVQITIFDINGKIVLNKQVVDNKIDISFLKKGIYYIKKVDKSVIFTSKFIKV